MRDHKVTPDDEVEITHTTMGEMFGIECGSFHINEKDLKTFLNLYGDASILCVKQGINNYPFHIVERPCQVGPLIVDLDFRQKESKRKYNKKFMKYIVGKYNEAILEYIETDEDNYEALIFEKDEPTHDQKQNNYKDGFHIYYPKIIIDASLRFKILEDVKEKVAAEKGMDKLECVNTIDDIFDKRIVMMNGMMMCGSKKPKSSQYKLTYVFKENDNKIEEIKAEYDLAKIIQLTCLRLHTEKDTLTFDEDHNNEKFKKELEEFYSKHYKKSKKEKTAKKSKPSNDDNNNNDDNDKAEKPIKAIHQKKSTEDVVIARKLVKILSVERATGFDTWIRVGWALRCIDDELYDAFEDFSQKCANKFDRNECMKIWEKASDNGSFTIASLYWWAKEDNHEQYLNILRENVKAIILEAESGTHDDIAKVVFELYKYNYKCSSIGKNAWYEFQGHRWVSIDCGYTLANRLSDELTKEFAKLASQYLEEGFKKEGFEREKYIDKGNKIMKVINQLKNQSFKNQILSSCTHRFYDKKFEEKLDDNPYILGFNNGVYDLKNLGFRNGVPDDYISLSVGYDYKEFNRNDPKIVEIEEYFKKGQTEEDMREYILTLISSYLVGINKEQVFVIWTGSGANGKSTTIDLIRYTFGDYFGVLPVTILTKKRGSSSNATPELADKRGKRFLAIQEPEHDDTIYVGLMKELTGNDMIQARALFSDPFMYKPQFKLVLTCNKLPSIPSHDGGTWRRIRVSPWESKFIDEPKGPKEFIKDKDLTEKMKKWDQGFIWLLLNIYYPKYIKGAMKEPKKVTQHTDNYKKDTDVYWEFLTENVDITKDENDSESISNLYHSFKNWYKESRTDAGCPARKNLANYLTDNKYRFEEGKVYGMKLKV